MADMTNVIDMSDLKDLNPTAKRLNAESDQFNKTIQTIQDRLNALGIGLETWVDEPLSESDWREQLDRDDEPNGLRECDLTELGYGRTDEGWALLVRVRRMVESPHSAYSTPETRDFYQDRNPYTLLRAPRELRIRAVELLPKLIDTIKQKAEEAIERLERAKKIADSLI